MSLARLVKDKVDEGRHIIVLSDRRKHLLEIHDKLQSIGVSSVGFMVGGKTSKKIYNPQYNRVILATYAFTSEGVDIPSLDTAVFATPRSDVVQTAGFCVNIRSRKYPLL